MVQILIILTTGFLACKQSSHGSKQTDKKQEVIESKISNIPAVGEKIQGDFNGNKQTDFATATKIKEAQGNPVESGTPDEYEIQFSDDNIKSIGVGCCNVRLINEGDFNNDGADEISVFQAPMNGCTYSMKTYSFTNGKWKQIIESFLIPTFCDNISDDDLQKRIFKEGSSIYYLYTGLNDEKAKLLKKKAIAK